MYTKLIMFEMKIFPKLLVIGDFRTEKELVLATKKETV